MYSIILYYCTINPNVLFQKKCLFMGWIWKHWMYWKVSKVDWNTFTWKTFVSKTFISKKKYANIKQNPESQLLLFPNHTFAFFIDVFIDCIVSGYWENKYWKCSKKYNKIFLNKIIWLIIRRWKWKWYWKIAQDTKTQIIFNLLTTKILTF